MSVRNPQYFYIVVCSTTDISTNSVMVLSRGNLEIC